MVGETKSLCENQNLWCCLRSSLPISSTTKNWAVIWRGPTGSHVDQQNLIGQANHTCPVQGSGEIPTKQMILAKRPRSDQSQICASLPPVLHQWISQFQINCQSCSHGCFIQDVIQIEEAWRKLRRIQRSSNLSEETVVCCFLHSFSTCNFFTFQHFCNILLLITGCHWSFHTPDKDPLFFLHRSSAPFHQEINCTGQQICKQDSYRGVRFALGGPDTCDTELCATGLFLKRFLEIM